MFVARTRMESEQYAAKKHLFTQAHERHVPSEPRRLICDGCVFPFMVSVERGEGEMSLVIPSPLVLREVTPGVRVIVLLFGAASGRMGANRMEMRRRRT